MHFTPHKQASVEYWRNKLRLNPKAEAPPEVVRELEITFGQYGTFVTEKQVDHGIIMWYRLRVRRLLNRGDGLWHIRIMRPPQKTGDFEIACKS